MKYLILQIFCIYGMLSLGACKSDASHATEVQESNIEAVSLQLLWETDTLFSTCESVLYDSDAEVLYVSNINEGPWVKDDNGFISTMDKSGKILTNKWVEGLSAPKGMGIVNGMLYVTDIDQLVEIDIATQSITQRYTIDGDPALNDITTGPDGTVYFSGSSSNTIYALSDGVIDTLIATDFGRLNGLYHDDEGIYYATSGSSQFGIYERHSGEARVIAEGIGQGDGIVRLSDGSFIISSWQGQIFHVDAESAKMTELLDTREAGLNAADIELMGDDLLLVPTFFGNKVMCYRIKGTKTQNK